MPLTTTNHLIWLEQRGFDDALFRNIHQFGDDITIADHRKYCLKAPAFNDGRNRRTRERLAMLRTLLTAWHKRKTGEEEPQNAVPEYVWKNLIELSNRTYA